MSYNTKRKCLKQYTQTEAGGARCFSSMDNFEYSQNIFMQALLLVRTMATFGLLIFFMVIILSHIKNEHLSDQGFPVCARKETILDS